MLPIHLENFVYYIHMIRKTKEGYRVLSEKGRNMGTYKTKKDANLKK